MSKFILSADSLRLLLNDQLKYFNTYDLDLPAIVACGVAIMSSDVPEVACRHLVDDFRTIGRFQVFGDELFDILMSSSQVLKSHISQLVGYEVQNAHLVGFTGNDPILTVSAFKTPQMDVTFYQTLPHNQQLGRQHSTRLSF